MLLGGTALTRTYVERDLRQVYDGRLFYGKDAFEGLRTMDRLVELAKSGAEDPSSGASSASASSRRAERHSGGDTGRGRAGEAPHPGPLPEVETDNPSSPRPSSEAGSRRASHLMTSPRT